MRKKFTDLFPADLAFDEKSRIQKGKKIIAVLKDSLGDLSDLSCLDLGCSVGIISGLLADNFKEVIGVDVDEQALQKARQLNKKNIKFLLSTEKKIPLKDKQVDVIVCNQIYEHVEDPKVLINEMYRILKLNGTIYFGARNKFGFFDGHYPIPFIAWIPHVLANFLIKVCMNKDEYDIRLFSLVGLNNLTKRFKRDDYTLKVISDPVKFASIDILPSSRFFSRLITIAGKLLYFFVPNYIWVLKKELK